MTTWILRLMLLFVLWLIGAPGDTAPHIWSVIGIDAKGDARDVSLADAAQLAYHFDRALDTVWFRVGLYNQPAAKDFSMKITVGGRAVTVPAVRDGHAIVAHVKRTDITSTMTFAATAAVGVNGDWNDAVPDMPPMAVDLSAPRPARGLRELDTSRNNFRLSTNVTTLADNMPARAVQAGRGSRTFILIPGVYSGDAVFGRFIARNVDRYNFHLLTPPGLSNTPPRPLPPEDESHGEFTWTRRLARDIRELVERNRLERPIVVVHGFPGSLAAEELASTHPQLLGGIIEVASMPVQPAPSFSNAGRESTPEERIAVVDASWAQQWFKYVTTETWESNNYPAPMFANDPDRAERTRRQVEAVPLAIKIRYLTEFMASDHRQMLAALAVPLLAVVPGFNERVLAEPAHGWFKTNFQDGWAKLPANPRRQLVTIADGRALLLDDQPEQADRAIAVFATESKK